jgi:hypothetical protein
MSDLRFITDETLRKMIERDKKELDRSLEHGLHKSTLLLAGSIIEAILVDFFLAFPRSGTTSEQVLDTNLSALVSWAEQDGLISPRTKELSTVIRHYRNLIHPGREYRLQEKMDVHTAIVAGSLVEIIIQEVAENYAKRIGYTAAQVISKIQLDPSCSSIFGHIVDRMVPIERVNLFKSIPETCASDNSMEDAVLDSFINLHNLMKTRVPPEVVKTEVALVYNRVRSSAKWDAMFHMRFFADDLDMLENDQRQAVLAYLLSILEQGNSEELTTFGNWGIFRNVGKYFNSSQSLPTLQEAILKRLKHLEIVDSDSDFLSILEDAYFSLDYKHWQAIMQALREQSWNERALEWAEYLGNIIPF